MSNFAAVGLTLLIVFTIIAISVVGLGFETTVELSPIEQKVVTLESEVMRLKEEAVKNSGQVSETYETPEESKITVPDPVSEDAQSKVLSQEVKEKETSNNNDIRIYGIMMIVITAAILAVAIAWLELG